MPPTACDSICARRSVKSALRRKGRVGAVIYLDVLLCVNLIVNYFIILASRFFTGDIRRRGRFAAGALAGSLFSLAVLLPELGAAASGALKLAGCCVMALVSFGFGNIRRFALRAAYIFLSSALFAGAVYALRETAVGNVLAARNLSVYAAVDPLTLIALIASIYLLLCLFELVWGAPRRLAVRYSARVKAAGGETRFAAMLDTGNKLRDPLTGREAAVLRRSIARAVLTRAQLEALEGYERGALDPSALRRCPGAVLLPFATISESGLLLAFPAEYLEVSDGVKSYRTEGILVTFALSELPSGCDGIVSASIIEEVYHVGAKDKGGAARAARKARGRRGDILHKRLGNAARPDNEGGGAPRL